MAEYETDHDGAPSAVEEPWWIRLLEFPLVALVVALALALTAYVGAYFLLRYEPPMSASAAALTEVSLAIGLVWVVYKLVIAQLGDKPRDDLPVNATSAILLAQGLALGALLFACVVGLAALVGAYAIVGPGDARQLVWAALLVAILPGFWEEMLFRGILFRWLEEFGGSWFALAATSALFGLAHVLNPNATWWSSLAIALEAGVLLGAAYMATRSLWLPMGLHAAWNFTQGEIFGVPVSGLSSAGLVDAELRGPDWLSGGPFGLEASVLSLAVCGLAGVALLRLAHRRGQIFGPMWARPGALTLAPQRKL